MGKMGQRNIQDHWENSVLDLFGRIKIVGKTMFWIFLEGLTLGFIKRYLISFVVTTTSALAMQCGTTTLWKKSYKISMWQPMIIVLLGILGIVV